MSSCTSCGHDLGAVVVRFCPSCGQRVPGAYSSPWGTDTAERPAVRGVPAGVEDATVIPDEATVVPDERTVAPTPRPAPIYATTPPPARFPLYADEPQAAAPAPADDPAWLIGSPGARQQGAHPRRGLLPWTAAAVLLLLVAASGGFLLLGGSGDDTAADPTSPTTTPATSASPGPSAASAGPPSASSRAPSAPPPASTTPGRPADVTGRARVSAPASAPPGRSVSGRPVRYVAANMLDGDPATAWRMPGDGTGSTIKLTLSRPTTLGSVGLINGYAKSEPGYDGYHANRRITAVRWTFDDGQTVSQSLHGTRRVQRVNVPGVTTAQVRLTILSVTGPGRGRSGRDYTAISDLAVVGTADTASTAGTAG